MVDFTSAPCATCGHPQARHHPWTCIAPKICVDCYDDPGRDGYAHPYAPGSASTAMDTLAAARADLRTNLLKGVKGTHAEERVDMLIEIYQRALKKVARAKHLREAADLVDSTVASPGSPPDFVAAWNAGTNIASLKLRRMADGGT